MDTPKAPRSLPGVELFSELSVSDRLSVWLAAGAQPQQDVTVGPGRARFSWFGGHAGTCYELGPVEHVVFSPCLFAELGQVTAEGFVDHPRQVRDVWFAAGAAARIGIVTRWIRSLFEVGPVLPLLRRTEYVFQTSNPSDGVFGPNLLVHQVPAVAVFGSVILAVSVNPN